MNKGKLWKSLLIILVMGNMALTIWILCNMKRRPHPPKPHEDKRAFLIKELKLNDDQTKQYNILADQHFKEMDRLHDQKRECMNALLKMTMSDRVDSAKYLELMNTSATLEKQMDSTIFSHFSSIYEMCDPSQAKNFDKIIENAIAPPPGPPRPENHDHPPHEDN